MSDPEQIPDSLAQPSHGLDEEIELLRRAVRRLFDLSQGMDDGEAVKTLNILSAAAARLARLVQTQAQLPAAENELEAQLWKTLAEVQKEIKA